MKAACLSGSISGDEKGMSSNKQEVRIALHIWVGSKGS